MKAYTILLLLFLFCSKTYAQTCNYADALDTCFGREERNLLNQACAEFEELLSQRYPNKELHKAYKAYLEDLEDWKIKPEFYWDRSPSLIKEIKASSLFDKIWISCSRYDSILNLEKKDTLNNEPKEKQAGRVINPCFLINFRAYYFNCVLNQMTRRDLIDYFEITKEFLGLVYRAKAELLLRCARTKDFNNDLVKLTVVVEIYLEPIIMRPTHF